MPDWNENSFANTASARIAHLPIRLVFAAVVVHFLVSCASIKLDQADPIRGVEIEAKDARDIATQTRKTLEKDYEEEREYLRLKQGGKVGLPRVGIAMSGGGMRSAAFNIGVLSALYNNPKFDFSEIDYLSSVSGGSYALSWYYLQQYLSKASQAELFKIDGKYQEYIAHHGALFNPKKHFYPIGVSVLGIPYNLFVNGVFGWHLNTNGGRRFYENRIERTFHRKPDNDPQKDVKPEPPVSFGEFKQWLLDQQPKGSVSVPLFIINTTVISDEDRWTEADSMGASVFEFTPFRFGADSYGFWPSPKYPAIEHPFDIGRAVAVSGAALDSAAMVPGSAESMFASVANVDLGFFVDNPDPDSKKARRQHWFIPFPFYFFHHYQQDKVGIRIYLSDGAYSDNLGVFSLVRRLVQRIIIVDAEGDALYEFKSYRKLQSALRTEMGVDFSVPEIDMLLSEKCPCPDDGSREGAVCRRVHVGAKPAMSGHIEYFYHGTESLKPEPTEIEVLYVKLALNATAIDCDELDVECDQLAPTDSGRASDAIPCYYCKTKGKGKEEFGVHRKEYPQEPTADQNFSGLQFRAYRDLGYKVIEDWLKDCSKEALPFVCSVQN